MLDMRTMTVRDVQHRLKDVLAWAEKGESIEVTRRGKVVATVNPPTPRMAPVLPDYMARLKKNFSNGVKGKPASEIISEGREELR